MAAPELAVLSLYAKFNRENGVISSTDETLHGYERLIGRNHMSSSSSSVSLSLEDGTGC